MTRELEGEGGRDIVDGLFVEDGAALAPVVGHRVTAAEVLAVDEPRAHGGGEPEDPEGPEHAHPHRAAPARA